jgi:hypothetical protein
VPPLQGAGICRQPPRQSVSALAMIPAVKNNERMPRALRCHRSVSAITPVPRSVLSGGFKRFKRWSVMLTD